MMSKVPQHQSREISVPEKIGPEKIHVTEKIGPEKFWEEFLWTNLEKI